MKTTKLIIPTLALGAFSACSSANAAKKELKNTKPNIVFIFADDWGYGDLSAHGHKGLTTPNLDKMIAEGTEFTQFNVCSPVSSSSRTAVMTGHFPSRHGVHAHFATHEYNARRGMPDWLDPEVTMLPRLLQSAGYKTAHYGKWHLTNSFTPEAPVPMVYGYDDTRVFNGGGPQIPSLPAPYESAHWTEHSVNSAIDFIKKNKNEPFFVNLWIHESHQNVDPTPEMMQEFYPDLPEPQRSYYTVISSADKHIGRFMDFLKEAGLDDNTIVIFSSDNGPETASKRNNNSIGETAGLKGRKRSLYEGGVKVPFIVRMPGVVPSGVVNQTNLIAAVDLLPTFCSMAGVSLPEGYVGDGEDVSDLFIGKEFEKQKPVLQYWQEKTGGDTWPRLSAKDNKWKLVCNYNKSRVELYDYKNDWGEENNLADKHPEVVERLSSLAFEYYNSLDLKNRAK
ncbi:MAG: sulfatase-like hydrolase/transferase [Rikenellaceae bacterium]